MDDFRVGSVPSSDQYRHRQPSGSISRKRQKHQDEGSEQAETEAETVDRVSSGDDRPDGSPEPVEDYYVPSDPNSDS